jgi:hypothetical protein
MIPETPTPLDDEEEEDFCWKRTPPPKPVCPACGGALVERRGHQECSKCGRVVEGCCEGGRG